MGRHNHLVLSGYLSNYSSELMDNLERELAATMYPVARVKEELKPTPKRLGAILGHSCAYGVWMMEELAQLCDRTQAEVPVAQPTREQLALGEKFVLGIADDWYPALRRLAKRALCAAVDQDYEDMRDFLSAYLDAFSRKPSTVNGVANLGNSATELYLWMTIHWQVVQRMKSVHDLHQMLVKRFGPHRVGDLKRIEKICQRLELRFRKPGRPRRNR